MSCVGVTTRRVLLHQMKLPRQPYAPLGIKGMVIIIMNMGAETPAGCPYPYTILTSKAGGGDSFVTDNPTMKQVSAGLHGTCSKSRI